MSDAGETFEATVAAVRERVDPDPEERERLARATRRLRSRTEEAVADLPVEADVVQVGSTARNTWISGDRDIDVFVRFPPDLDREALETHGLRVGHTVLPGGREEFAEHPYVSGEVDGFDVDLVPCYRLDDASAVRSAVDRTPFHTKYLEPRLDDDLAGEVRVCKAFLKRVGVYGSDLRTRGVGGYLTELLVLDHGGFRSLVEAVADWRPPVRLDPGETDSEAAFDDPLAVVDPTDPDRNVASVVSDESLARFQHYARELLEDPRETLFESRDPDPLSPAAVREHLRDRDTTPVALVFPTPDVVDDQLYPQLRRTTANLASELERREFRPLRSTAFTDRDGRTDEDEASAVVLVECTVAELSDVEYHEGPPVAVRGHAAGFREKYGDGDGDSYGPFLDGDRYAVERTREYTTPDAALRGVLFDVGLGPDVERALETDHELLVDDELARLAEREGFAAELRRYFDPRP